MILHNDTEKRKEEREWRGWEEYCRMYKPTEVEKETEGAYEYKGKYYKDSVYSCEYDPPGKPYPKHKI